MNNFQLIEKAWILLMKNEKKIQYARKRGVSIGCGCSLARYTEWGSEPYLISLGNNVRISRGVRFITHDGGMHVLRNLYPNMKQADFFGKIQIGNNVFIGMNSLILPGVTIGDNVVIGAGSVVTKSIPSDCVACGVPARPIKGIQEYYEKYSSLVIQTKGLPDNEKKALILKHFLNEK